MGGVRSLTEKSVIFFNPSLNLVNTTYLTAIQLMPQQPNNLHSSFHLFLRYFLFLKMILFSRSSSFLKLSQRRGKKL